MAPRMQAMSYRTGHHSTSDDSARYRTRDEMQRWKARDPVMRFQRWLTANAWWDEAAEQELRQQTRKEVTEASLCSTASWNSALPVHHVLSRMLPLCHLNNP